MLHSSKHVNLPRTLLLLASLVSLLVLGACATDATPQAPTLEPAAGGAGFAFRIDPEAGTVTPVDSSPADSLQTQAEPGDTRPLVQEQDIRYTDFSFQFRAPDKVIVRLRVQNITDDLSFAQPFSFALSSDSRNIVEARAPLVTDRQLGGDGVLSPGETSRRFNFQAAFVEDEPFTFFVDTRALVVGPGECISPIDIPDEGLEREIRGALGKPEGELTCEDLTSLRGLDASEADIESIEGLQFAVNLTELDLRENDISDISPLANLTDLTSLNLGENGTNLSDIRPLANLTSLNKLTLFSNDISNLSSLEGLTNLTSLDLSFNAVSDVSALANNSGLDAGDFVDLRNNPLSAQSAEDVETLRARSVTVLTR